jgi:hypothetical protein
MDRLVELTLVIGIIFITTYSIRVNQEAVQSVNAMNKQIQMMFVRS